MLARSYVEGMRGNSSVLDRLRGQPVGYWPLATLVRAWFTVAVTRAPTRRCMCDVCACRRVRRMHMVLVCGCGMNSSIAAIPITPTPTTATPTYAPDGTDLHPCHTAGCRPAMGCALRGLSRCSPSLCKPGRRCTSPTACDSRRVQGARCGPLRTSPTRRMRPRGSWLGSRAKLRTTPRASS